MDYQHQHTLAILSRTPTVLRALLTGLPDEWTHATEGAHTWSAYDVVGHLLQGEQTDWIPRVRIILEQGEGTHSPRLIARPSLRSRQASRWGSCSMRLPQREPTI